MPLTTFATFRVTVLADDADPRINDEEGPLIDMVDTIDNLLRSIDGPAIRPLVLLVTEE